MTGVCTPSARLASSPSTNTLTWRRISPRSSRTREARIGHGSNAWSSTSASGRLGRELDGQLGRAVGEVAQQARAAPRGRSSAG